MTISLSPNKTLRTVRFIDLFCGIGGFHHAMNRACREAGVNAHCTLASDIDLHCQDSYEGNFGIRPHGDIKDLDSESIPDHELLLAGFPCQPFSIIGERKGFSDTRGTLFFEIARILEAKKPDAFVLENVKTLKGHDGGRTLQRILETLRDLGYRTDFAILNALDFGLPQKRERIWIVGNRIGKSNNLPLGRLPMKPLSKILESEVDPKHFASKYIRDKRHAVRKPETKPTIWHENKAGNISAYPYSCALRAGASYNYLLVNGERRLTPREMLRLQGFPDSHKIISSDSQTRKQAGNSLPVNVAEAVIREVLVNLGWISSAQKGKFPVQTTLCEKRAIYNEKTKAANS